jgi:hypothetical protein
MPARHRRRTRRRARARLARPGIPAVGARCREHRPTRRGCPASVRMFQVPPPQRRRRTPGPDLQEGRAVGRTVRGSPPCGFLRTKPNSNSRPWRHRRNLFNFLRTVTKAESTRTSRSSPHRRSSSPTSETPSISCGVGWTRVCSSSKHWEEAGTCPIFLRSVRPPSGTIEAPNSHQI